MTRKCAPQGAPDAPVPGSRPSLLWPAELTAARRDELLNQAAEWVVRKGLETPAILFLEMHKPLTTMAAVGYAFAQPPFMMLFGFERTEEVRLLLSDRANIEILANRIEQRSAARQPSEAQGKESVSLKEGGR